MQTISVIDDIDVLIENKTAQAAASTAKQTDEHGSWIIENNTLRNKSSDYFSISLYQTAKDETRYLIEQNNGALVMLVTAEHDGRKIALLSVRFEPGLIGKVNFTSTIQSTPSNYKREHGGKPTPFMDVVEEPGKFGEVIYDGEHYDWGGYYTLKKKRYLIVNVQKNFPAPDGFVWVTYELLHQMLKTDNLITNDLRVALPLLLHTNIQPTLSSAHANPAFPPQKLPFNFDTVDSTGVSVKFFEAKTLYREVSAWIQPLLVPSESMEIKLSYRSLDAKKMFAVQQRTQVGLSGKKLWFPAYIEGSSRHIQVTTCAEGGRFWQHSITIEIGEVHSHDFLSDDDDSIAWITEQELLAIVASPLTSSLELRMASSLMVRNINDD